MIFTANYLLGITKCIRIITKILSLLDNFLGIFHIGSINLIRGRKCTKNVYSSAILPGLLLVGLI